MDKRQGVAADKDGFREGRLLPGRRNLVTSPAPETGGRGKMENFRQNGSKKKSLHASKILPFEEAMCVQSSGVKRPDVYEDSKVPEGGKP